MGNLLRRVICVAAGGLLFAASAWAQSDQTRLSPIRLRSGINSIANIAGDGKAGSISLDWRDNGNAWSYDIYVVRVAGSVATVEDKDRFTDRPHTGEDMIKSVRFARGAYRGRQTTFALVAERDWSNSVPGPSATTIMIYVLSKNDSGLGTPYIFKKIGEKKTRTLYCNADMALRTELNFPLAQSYSGAMTVDGC